MLFGKEIRLIDLGNCCSMMMPKLHLISTVGYRAPEVELGEWDRSVDLYSIGKVILELLTGSSNFDTEKL